MEIITIYRKMKKGRQNQNIYRTLLNVESSQDEVSEFEYPTDQRKNSVYDFCRFRNLKDSKYIFYSQETSLIESNTLFCSDQNLFDKKFFWINIFNPNETDLEVLADCFDVHDISLMDIRERNTEEKTEVFKHYTFISLKLFSEANWKDTEDIDFNILMFQDFIITTHDKPWGGINDIINFLSLISAHTTLYPDWVLYSVIIEFLQDLKFITSELENEIENVRDVTSADENNIEEILRHNFNLAFKLYSLRNTIKPKVNILNMLKMKCIKRLRKSVLKHLTDCLLDFKKQEKEVKEFGNILERCQDLCLAIVNMLQSKEGNAMNKSMKWFTLITFIFLPCQTVSGLWGMNVKVPGQDGEGLSMFWVLTLIGPMISLMYFYFNGLLRKNKKKNTY